MSKKQKTTEPGLYYETADGTWAFAGGAHAWQGCSIGVLHFRESLGRLEMVLSGFSGRATDCWPVLSRIVPRISGHLHSTRTISRWELILFSTKQKTPPMTRWIFLATDTMANATIIPLPTEAIAKRLGKGSHSDEPIHNLIGPSLGCEWINRCRPPRNVGTTSIEEPRDGGVGYLCYAKEMDGIVPLPRMGGILPRRSPPTPTRQRTLADGGNQCGAAKRHRTGQRWHRLLPRKSLALLKSTNADIVVSIAGKSLEDFVYLAERLGEATGLFGVELNVSCPNVSGGVDFGTDPKLCYEVVSGVRAKLDCPIVTKLTPNVSRIVDIAKAARDGGSDAVSCINTVLGMVVDWRKQKAASRERRRWIERPCNQTDRTTLRLSSRYPGRRPVIGIGGSLRSTIAWSFLSLVHPPSKLAQQITMTLWLVLGSSINYRRHSNAWREPSGRYRWQLKASCELTHRLFSNQLHFNDRN